MSDPGHNAAEEIVQRKQDNHHGDLADVLEEKEKWAYCPWCMIRQDHEHDGNTWRCSFCGQENKSLSAKFPPRQAITTVAETYLKENPEE